MPARLHLAIAHEEVRVTSKNNEWKTSSDVKQQQYLTSQKPPGGALEGTIFGVLLGYRVCKIITISSEIIEIKKTKRLWGGCLPESSAGTWEKLSKMTKSEEDLLSYPDQLQWWQSCLFKKWLQKRYCSYWHCFYRPYCLLYGIFEII